ncbi:MAG: hypothetical protein IPM42_06055 [Saprospiraceae bacterium]|nr:hypothetical protein [Saprospiraceae bacterium]
MQYNLKFLIFLFIISVGISCRQKVASTDDAKGTPVYMTEEFLTFIDKFSTDSLFQMEHILFPLEGKPAMKDSLDVIPDDFRWQKEDWTIHRPYDDMNGTFTRELVDFNGIVMEIISDTSGKYSMERRFSKLDDEWHLIYYKSMGVHEW